MAKVVIIILNWTYLIIYNTIFHENIKMIGAQVHYYD